MLSLSWGWDLLSVNQLLFYGASSYNLVRFFIYIIRIHGKAFLILFYFSNLSSYTTYHEVQFMSNIA